MTDQTIYAVGIPSGEAFGVPTVLREALFPEGATIEDYRRALAILTTAQQDADPIAAAKAELPAQAPRFAQFGRLVKTTVELALAVEVLQKFLELVGVLG